MHARFTQCASILAGLALGLVVVAGTALSPDLGTPTVLAQAAEATPAGAETPAAEDTPTGDEQPAADGTPSQRPQALPGAAWRMT